MSLPFKIDLKRGLLEGVRFLPSPNINARPSGMVPELLVIHAISLPPGEFGGPWIDQLFCNTLDAGAHAFFAQLQGLKVSAHALIRRDGEVVQYVPFHLRAWHAGISCYQGRENCNDFSIGIELEGCDHCAFEPIQYAVLNALIDALVIAYPRLNRERIVGHSDIAPGRKTDPGPYFDWHEIGIY
ncbi:1,6-anhydro-N-acetylmuramyl-L-alanine amidase AmpD [Thiorhodospira sibirica]|uniref:1,6-anhydro-N-acetylmuramyl-L-alanine amidase AmpD n=1 Tax=Thiorhodospira sibirica TaxID=154347 RepID=UPI00022C52BA|nr:1,6-anhydro-N-acetylmuramyl-L-alanine amidase AmpD [Thiorhodospira sibirica]